MSRGSLKHDIRQYVDHVKYLIERCLELYMNSEEVVSTLQEKAKIEPLITKIVWHRLKAENQAFFKNYYTILALSQQIEQYNALLEKQRQLMVSEQTIAASLPISNGLHHHVVPSLPNSNGSHLHAIIENPTCYYADVQTPRSLNHGNILHGANSSLSNVSNNGGSSFGMVGMFARGDISSMPYYNTQNSNMGLQQEINGWMTISEPEYSSSSPHMFGIDGNIMEASPNASVASSTPITNVEPNSNFVNEPLPRNFSFPDPSLLASKFFGKNSSPCLSGVSDDYPGSPS